MAKNTIDKVGYNFATIKPNKIIITACPLTPTLPLALFRMAIIIYPRHGIWYIAWVGISNPLPVDGAVTVRAYPLYVKQEDFSDITATAKHQFRDQYAREGYQLQKFCNHVRPVRTRWRGIPWNCSLHETEWWWCVDYRRICAQDALWRCFMRVHQSHVSGVINRVTWPLMLCWWLSRLSESGLCLIFCDKYARVASKLSDGVCCWQYEDR